MSTQDKSVIKLYQIAQQLEDIEHTALRQGDNYDGLIILNKNTLVHLSNDLNSALNKLFNTHLTDDYDFDGDARKSMNQLKNNDEKPSDVGQPHIIVGGSAGPDLSTNNDESDNKIDDDQLTDSHFASENSVDADGEINHDSTTDSKSVSENSTASLGDLQDSIDKMTSQALSSNTESSTSINSSTDSSTTSSENVSDSISDKIEGSSAVASDQASVDNVVDNSIASPQSGDQTDDNNDDEDDDTGSMKFADEADDATSSSNDSNSENNENDDSSAADSTDASNGSTVSPLLKTDDPTSLSTSSEDNAADDETLNGLFDNVNN